MNRRVSHCDDGRYGLSHLPDCEFHKYDQIAKRVHQRSNVCASKPFIDIHHHKLYEEGAVLHSIRYLNSSILSLPYVKVQYSFTVWGETYVFEFDALYEPAIGLEKRDLSEIALRRRATLTGESGDRRRSKSILAYVLSFNPPDEKMLRMDLPSSVIVFDVRRPLRLGSN